MAKKIKALLCVAHPDDETIFFAGLLSQKKYDWTVVCATDASADGQGSERLLQFKKACRKLGVQKTILLKFPDRFGERLPADQLISKLSKLKESDHYQYVYTHGPLGEYGHYHHQDVCFATYQVFTSKRTKVFSVAYNLYPEMKIQYTNRIFQLKAQILRKIYAGESMRFLGLLPATFIEGYVQLTISEVQFLYSFITQKCAFDAKKLKHYRWLADYIQNRDYELKTRPF